jgi:hypothetical protein
MHSVNLTTGSLTEMLTGGEHLHIAARSTARRLQCMRYVLFICNSVSPCLPPIIVDGKALPPPAGGAQRWDLLMKPLAKVKSPEVPPWSAAKKVLSPTQRPMSNLEFDNETEHDAIKRVDRYIMYITAQLGSAAQQIQSVQHLEGATPVLYLFSEAPLRQTFDLSTKGMSLPAVGDF